MKTTHKNIGRLLAFFSCLIIAQQVSASLVPVPYYAQRSFFAATDTNHLNNLSDWCWDASSEMVLNTPLSASYPGTFYDQDTIAAFGSQGSNYWNYLYGSAPRSTNVTTGAIQPALKGIDLILKNFGPLNSQSYGRPLTSAELQTEMDSGRPVVARLGWCNSAAGTAYANNGGGHFVVLYGFDGTVVSINDPWPDSGPVLQSYTSFANSSSTGGVYTANSSRFKWTHSLTLDASIDVCFLIDTTGSMGGSISAVQAAAISIATNIIAHFPGARIAVKDFKDNPIHDSSSAYLDEIDTPFTTNLTDIQNAVNPLSAYGGGDEPEALYSALMFTLNNTSWSGGSLGGWSTNSTPRIIIVATDAPGHDPVEPWAGGFSIGDVIANAMAKQISIYGLAAGGDAIADLSTLADGTGGAEFDTTYAGVADAITNVVNLVFASTRHPQGVVTTPKPTFTFTPGNVGMGGVPTGYTLQILKSNDVTHVWALYLETPVIGGTYTPSSPLPVGTYEWRLGSEQPATTILSPAGGALSTIPTGIIYENGYTEFERIVGSVISPTLITPPGIFSSSSFASRSPQSNSGNVTFVFGTTGASSYLVTINVYNPKSGKSSVWRTVTVKPPAKNPSASTLSLTMTGFNASQTYSWSVAPLSPE